MVTTPTQYRHTKIIFTIGPSTDSPEKLQALIHEGVDVCRINMAHADEEWTRAIMAKLREACKETGREIASMIDVKGPEIRTGKVDEPIDLKVGDILKLWTTEPPASTDAGVYNVGVNYAGLPGDLTPGATMLLDSGLIQLEVMECSPAFVKAKVVIPGKLGSRRHINLPGVEVNLPSLTEKDRKDIQVGIEEGVDFIALSFVRNAQAVNELRDLLKHLGSDARIISKIEDQAGLKNLEEIIMASDAIMVARGDLGIEISYEKLPTVQRNAVFACQKHGKPVIVATHLLESMTNAPVPTRAEVTDVSNAVREQTDCIMLSGETTMGSYPLECVRVMKRVINATEATNTRELNRSIVLKTPKAKLLRSAAVLAQELEGIGVVVFTRSGFLPHVLAALRPNGIPIYAFTDVRPVFRQMLMLWGVEPFMIDFDESDPEETIQRSFDYLCRRGWCKPGDQLAVITNALARDKIIDTLQLRDIPMPDAPATQA